MNERTRVRLKTDGRVVVVNPDGSEGDEVQAAPIPQSAVDLSPDGDKIIFPELNKAYTPGAHPESRIACDMDGDVYLIHNDTAIAVLHNARTGVEANLLRANYHSWTRWQ